MSRVAVLGCGPAGLIAAHRLEQLGYDPEIYSLKRKSPISGAQYLHEPIIGASEEESSFLIEYVKVGSSQGYALNTYGDENHPVSWDKFQSGAAAAWPLKDAYDILWNRFEDRIVDQPVDPDFFTYAASEGPVVSTIPRKHVCMLPGSHRFNSQQIVICKGSPERLPCNTILYNGTREDGGATWYRTSNIQGEVFTEFSREAWENPFRKANASLNLNVIGFGYKPTSTDCCCHPDVTFAGRFGIWDKQVLLHDVINSVDKGLQVEV